MPKQSSARPTNKVIAGTFGAAVATIGLYVLERIMGEPLPPEVNTAVTTLVTFALGYFVPPSSLDTLDMSDGVNTA